MYSAVEQRNLAWNFHASVANSDIARLFMGMLRGTVQCLKCGHRSYSFDQFWDLSLPIPVGSSSPTLADCFREFTTEEVRKEIANPFSPFNSLRLFPSRYIFFI